MRNPFLQSILRQMISVLSEIPIESPSVLPLVAPLSANMPSSDIPPPMTPLPVIPQPFLVDPIPLTCHSITISLTQAISIFDGLNFGSWASGFEDFLRAKNHRSNSSEPSLEQNLPFWETNILPLSGFNLPANFSDPAPTGLSGL